MRVLVGIAAATLGLGLGANPVHAAEGRSPWQFALLGDPQIGYGPGGELGGHGRFEQVVSAVNASPAEVAILAGDLVQDRTFLQHWLFDRARTALRPKALLVAGNHDVVDSKSLQAFRDAYGPDYYEWVQDNTAFVVLNSETARSPGISAQEFEAQWRFIETTLNAQASAGREHVILAMHRPPFVDDEAEPEADANWPLEPRARLLALARKAHVQWILAGHLHRRHEAKTKDGITVVVDAGSASSFDHSPIGYRSFDVAGEALSQQWHTIAEGPGAAWSVPGFRNWTPRLMDFSIRHWLLTLLYVAGGIAALRPARQRGVSQPWLWRTVAYALFFFGANMQLDIDEFAQEVARMGAIVTGLTPIRHLVTGTLLLLALSFTALWLFRSYRKRKFSRPLFSALTALVVPATWFALSVISHHYIEMVFREDIWDLLSLAAIAVVIRASSVTLRPQKAKHAR